MGWYLRKSLGFGPFRLNLSKSGIGASVGVRGARIGISPRGNYVRLGRGGLYYQRYFHSKDRSLGQAITPVIEPLGIADPEVPILSADVSHLHDSTAETLLAELRDKRKKIQRAPIFAVASVLTTILLLAAHLPLWLTLAFAVAFVCVHAAMIRSDYETKLAVLNYEFDSEARDRYVKLLGALQSLANSARIWRVTGEQRSRDTKYTAGAHRMTDKKSISLRLTAPKFVTTKLAVWEMSLGDQNLYFFPDRILIYQGSEVGAAQYGSLTIDVHLVAFVESDSVPSDSQVIAQTWRYVNKKGGPDRRFSSNPQIPIAKYGELTVRSASGMNFVLQCSNPERAADFKEGIEAYTRHL